MKKLIRIAIPTFNRSKSLIGQLLFFKGEIDKDTLNDIEFVVYNNASTDNTKEIVSLFQLENDWLSYIENKENIGLVGNINKIFRESEASYTWAVGDDDTLEIGILKEILEVLRSRMRFEWLFINHDAYDEQTKEIKMKAAINIVGGFHKDGKKAITEIFTFSRTTPMLITACIYRTITINEVIKLKFTNNLVDPLDYSFYCASKGTIYIFDKLLIHNKWGTTSWSSEVNNVMFYGVFSVLNSLKFYGYTNKQITSMKRVNLKFNLVNQIYGFFRGDNLSYKLFKYYNLEILKNLFSLFFSKLKNFKK